MAMLKYKIALLLTCLTCVGQGSRSSIKIDHQGFEKKAYKTDQGFQSHEEAKQSGAHMKPAPNKRSARLMTLIAASNPVSGFSVPAGRRQGIGKKTSLASGVLSRPAITPQGRGSPPRLALNDQNQNGDAARGISTQALYDAASRDERYGGNIAQYLVDLHDANATFNFCGGMMFQLALSDKLRSVLAEAAKGDGQQLVVNDAAKARMYQVPKYTKSADADNVMIFHGREVRQIPNAAGDMGMVLQLSYAGEDPEGWTPKEIAEYNGWAPDVSRTWNLAREAEAFRNKFGGQAVTLQHRFYLHFDKGNRIWLSAEDGCEGTPEQSRGGLFSIFR